MFELNSLATKYYLRDLERRFTPQLGKYRAERTAPRFSPVYTRLAYAVVTLILGVAYIA